MIDSSARASLGRPALVAASLSGESDASWARGIAERVDVAILGGIALDPASRAAARDLVERDRSEFLPASPFDFIDDQLSAIVESEVGLRPGFNLRSATLGPIRTAASICADHGAVCEMNAHCRQPELCAVGCGESLLREPDRLAEYVSAAAGTGATTGVKVRAEVEGVDLTDVAVVVGAAGADWLHVDAMDSEHVIADLRRTIDREGLAMGLIANNGVRTRGTVAAYAAHGADAVSVARPTRTDSDSDVLRRVADAVREWRGGTLLTGSDVRTARPIDGGHR